MRWLSHRRDTDSASAARRPHALAWLFALAVALPLASCQSINVATPDALNEHVDYLPWRSNGMRLLPGMELRIYASSLAPRGKNEQTPTTAADGWVLPSEGQVSRADWVRLQHLLSASVRNDATTIDIGRSLKTIADALAHDDEFSSNFGKRVVGQAVASMHLVYLKYSEPTYAPVAGYIRRVVCEGSFADFSAFDVKTGRRLAQPSRAAVVARGAPPASVFVHYSVTGLGDFYAYTGDDWYLQKDIGQLGRSDANEWYKPSPVDPIDARQVPDAAIRVQFALDGRREWASPCLSLSDVETRTGATLSAVRRSADFLDTDDAKLRKKLIGRDGRFAIAFGQLYELGGAQAYYKAKKELKKDFVLAHGDVLVLSSPTSQSTYRLD
jgi:hypothetical protein